MRVIGNRNQPALVFIHGFLGSGDDWLAVANSLKHRYCCYLISLPGHDCEALPNKLNNWDEFIYQIQDNITNQLPEKFILVGYSLGGRVSIALSQLWPERINALILESANPGLQTTSEREHRRSADNQWTEWFESLELEIVLDKWYQQAVFKNLDQEQRQSLINIRRNQDGSKLSTIMKAASLSAQPDYWNSIATNNMKTLFLAGEHDQKFSTIGRRLKTLKPNMTFIALPNLGHNCHHENPELFSQHIMQFAEQIYPLTQQVDSQL